jgi:hypothetical protein
MKKTLVVCVLMLLAVQGFAKEIAGITISEQIVRETDQVTLVLNGTGIREKFFFDIYLAALYLEQRHDNAASIIEGKGPARVVMSILYSEITKEKFGEAWQKGFSSNLKPEELKKVAERLEQFKDLLETLRKNDQIILDYFPAKGTEVRIKGVVKGSIHGEDFFQALLKVWLGDAPVSESLKAGLLGH